MEQQARLIETSWQRGVSATREWQFAALFNLDRFRELQGCSIFTDPGGSESMREIITLFHEPALLQYTIVL